MGDAVLPLLVEVAKPMIESLRNRFIEEINLVVWGFRKKLKKLHRKIQPIASIVLNMNDADEAVEPWLRNVVSILYNAEDMLDVLAYEKQRDVVMKRRLLFWPLKRAYFRRKIGKWISRINANIEEALTEAQTIVQLRTLLQSAFPLPAAGNIIRDKSAAAEDRLQQVRRNVDMSLIVGRDSHVHSVGDKLCNPSQDWHNASSNRLRVVAVVGFGGIGKTVLAKKVIEDKRVTDKFTQRFWVVVSEDFSIDRILNKMLEFVNTSSSATASSNDIAVRKLKENLDGKRYLLVLDDVWNRHQDIWDGMQSSLGSIGGSQESMILVTTRDNVVAQTMHAFVYPLPELSEDYSWSLFKQVAFAKMSQDYISMFETTGRKIVQKCKGVPLAIKTIAGMLQTKRRVHEWEKIEQSELWDLPQDDTGILPSLKLSYKHLSSPSLKKCFCFCAILPKDFRMNKDWLTYCWMALGLIQQSDDRDLIEDIAEEYINALLSISFLHEEGRNELGDIIWYGMHDLMHDLARSVSGHELLFLETGHQVKTISDVRHLAIYKHKELTSDCWDKGVVKNLRTLDITKILTRGLLEHVKYLRILSLESMGLEEVPESIAGLKCLKFLSLTGNPIKVLPEFITELYNLQSLNLDHCDLLKEVPGGFSNLVNLRRFKIRRLISLPAGMIGQLRCLQTLPVLAVRERGFQIFELGGLPHVSGNLEIQGLELVKCKLDAEEAKLSMKYRVEQLRLIWDNDDKCTNHEEVLDGLYPNRNLKLLLLKGYAGDNFPSWLMRMNVSQERNHAYAGALYNLVKLQLIDCERCQQLPTLGHLPSLKKLEITNMFSLECITPEFYCRPDLLLDNEEMNPTGSCSSSLAKSNPMVYFKSLEELRLCGLCNLVEWCQPSCGKWNGFPSLDILVIEDCPELKITPYKFPSLKQLTVRNITSGLPLSNIITNKGAVTGLKILRIDGVTDITHLPEELVEYCISLQTLRINRCQNLTCLPESLSKLISLEVLEIRWCHKLVSLPNLGNLGSLCQLDIFENEGLTSAPEGLQSCKSLEILWLNCCPKVETLPQLTALIHLRDLSIRNMTKMITHPPDWLYTLPCLKVLHIGSYWERDDFPDMSFIMEITSLETLFLFGWEKLQSVPEQLQHWTTLKELGIYDFENLEHLPDWLGKLSSLQELYLYQCRNLKKLATKDAMKRLSKLSYLEIKDCPLLEEAVKFNGTEHYKVSHIQVQILYPAY